MKKIAALFFVLVVGMVGCRFTPSFLFKETPSSGIVVSTQKELKTALERIYTGNEPVEERTIILANNIDLSEDWDPIGSRSAPFQGILDGNGKSISGINIRSSSAGAEGFFAHLGNLSEVHNLILRNPNIIGTSNFVGALAGNSNGSIIENVRIEGGIVSGGSNNARIGGLIGLSGAAGIITRSYSTALVEGNDVLQHVGGFVGENRGIIENSYASGSVKGLGADAYVGGFVGLNNTQGIIKICYATGAVEGASSNVRVGGFAGTNDGGVLQDNYFDTEMTQATPSHNPHPGIGGVSSSQSGVTGITVGSITEAGFPNWDTEIWTFTAGQWPNLQQPTVPIDGTVVLVEP